MNQTKDDLLTVFSRREIKRRAKAMFPALVRSMTARALLFVLVVLLVGIFSKPWKWEWLKPDEATSIASEFLSKQNVDLARYTSILAVDYRSDGVWNGKRNEYGFEFHPAVSYLLRFFDEGKGDSWILRVSPTGRIHGVQHDVPDDIPGHKLSQMEAIETVVGKLSTDLSLPAYQLKLISDSLAERPLRHDWYFVFSMNDSQSTANRLYVKLSGKEIARFASAPEDRAFHPPARGGMARSRLIAFALIIFGVLQIVLHHRHPLAWHKGLIYGGVAFLLVLLIRGLTFSQSAILVPAQGAGGHFVRVGLSGVIEAVQISILVGLIIATGESISRDLLPNVTTFTRIAPSHRGWTGAWIQAGRHALPVAAIVLTFEAAIALWFEPGGLSGKALPIVAGALSSPVKSLASAALISRDVLWDEGLYRLWLFPLLVFWVRGSFTALMLVAGCATYFAGFDLSDFLSLGGGQFIIWSLIAGWLMLRVGILAAMMFHVLVLGSYTALALVWTGFGKMAGAILLAAMICLLAVIVFRADHLVRTSGESA